jgi:hypothetical protein
MDVLEKFEKIVRMKFVLTYLVPTANVLRFEVFTAVKLEAVDSPETPIATNHITW